MFQVTTYFSTSWHRLKRAIKDYVRYAQDIDNYSLFSLQQLIIL